MYCVKCGVCLADTEKSCPLCGTVVYHPTVKQEDVPPLYPPHVPAASKPVARVLKVALLVLFLIPSLVSLVSDWQGDHLLTWCGYVTGGVGLAYVVLCLPLWFRKPNPVVFLALDCGAALAYLWYVNAAVGKDWFWSFALPVAGGLSLIAWGLVALLRYVKGGRLYMVGGTMVALGGWLLLLEYLLHVTFGVRFVAWSFYPLAVLTLLGGALIYLATNKDAREILERKLFF